MGADHRLAGERGASHTMVACELLEYTSLKGLSLSQIWVNLVEGEEMKIFVVPLSHTLTGDPDREVGKVTKHHQSSCFKVSVILPKLNI